MPNKPKKPWVAFTLSFLLPGAGLAYLGKWGWAALNLFSAFGIAILTAAINPDLASPMGMGVCAGSAVLAKNLVDKMNKKSAATPQNTGTEPPPVITAGVDNSFANKVAEPILVKPVNMVCAKCGAKTEAANFCAECGAPLS